jgi:hypothetical protein
MGLRLLQASFVIAGQGRGDGKFQESDLG